MADTPNDTLTWTDVYFKEFSTTLYSIHLNTPAHPGSWFRRDCGATTCLFSKLLTTAAAFLATNSRLFSSRDSEGGARAKETCEDRVSGCG